MRSASALRCSPSCLKTADIVTLHVPLDLSTHNLIGERELAMMKPTAILINTCRGPVVDEKALYAALRDEKILGAGLDVMVEEPPKPDHELFTLKNAIFSPHGAGPTWDNHWKRWRNALRQFRARWRAARSAFWIVRNCDNKRERFNAEDARARRGREGSEPIASFAEPLRPLR